MTLAELLALLATIGDMDDEQIAQYRSDLAAAAEERLAADATDEVLEELEQIAAALAQVKEAQETRAADAASRQERRDALAAQIADSTADPETESETEAESETGDETGDETEAVAASSTLNKPAKVTKVAARRPKSMTPKAPASRELPSDVAEWGLVAAANSPDMQPGSRITTVEQLGKTFFSAIKASSGFNGPAREKVKVVMAGSENLADLYDDSRILGDDPYANERKIKAVTSPAALAAAGGICAPPAVRYDIPVIGVDERPVWNEMLATYGVDRGRVTTINIPVIEDMANAVSFWTNANDISPSDPTVKPCLTVGCPDDSTGVIEAIVSCLKIGNFKMKYFGELIEAYIRIAAVNAARQVEVRHLATISTGSTSVTVGELLGTTRDVLAGLARARAIIDSRHRVRKESMPLRFGAPDWLRDNMRVDILRQLPVGTLDETLVLADDHINRWFSALNINPTWLLDGPAGQIFAAQSDGAMLGWPGTATTWLYPEGTWLGLDGGTLDFGIVRDSTLNGTNDFELFSESMQGVHYHGVESWEILFDICPNGGVAAAVEIDPCGIGS